jgi:hypothetical protein
MRDPGHGLEGPRATELAIIQARRDPGREQEGTLGSVTQPQRRCVWRNMPPLRPCPGSGGGPGQHPSQGRPDQARAGCGKGYL